MTDAFLSMSECETDEIGDERVTDALLSMSECGTDEIGDEREMIADFAGSDFGSDGKTIYFGAKRIHVLLLLWSARPLSKNPPEL